MPTYVADCPKSLKVKLNHASSSGKALKATDMAAAGEEDYHAQVSASVPFMWESQPGTPKVKFLDDGSLHSPLTPPPSYFSTPSPIPIRKSPKSKFLNTIFRKFPAATPNNINLPHSPASTSSSSSSSASSSPPPPRPERVKVKCHRRSSIDLRGDEEEDDDDEDDHTESPVSTLFFGGSSGWPRGCYPKLIKVFMRDSK